MHKKGLLILAVGIVIIIALFAFIAEFASTNKSTPTTAIQPTITPYTNELSPNPTAVDIANKLLNNVENRQPLSDTDAKTRQELIQNTTPQNDVVHQTSDYIIHYVQDADDFETEILSTNIETTKQATVTWFTSQGISSQGICRLPLNFYLNHNTADQMRSQGKSVIFNRIPDGC